MCVSIPPKYSEEKLCFFCWERKNCRKSWIQSVIKNVLDILRGATIPASEGQTEAARKTTDKCIFWYFSQVCVKIFGGWEISFSTQNVKTSTSGILSTHSIAMSDLITFWTKTRERETAESIQGGGGWRDLKTHNITALTLINGAIITLTEVETRGRRLHEGAFHWMDDFITAWTERERERVGIDTRGLRVNK